MTRGGPVLFTIVQNIRVLFEITRNAAWGQARVERGDQCVTRWPTRAKVASHPNHVIASSSDLFAFASKKSAELLNLPYLWRSCMYLL